jgi:hypothetical protein
MTLTRGDDYPIHQTPEPIAFAGTDRNFYDRYFFNGYRMESADETFFAVAFGVYPQLNIADAAFCVMRNGVQVNLHASKWLGMERMDLNVGPVSIDVEEPLQRLRVRVNAPEQGIRADIVFDARSAPIEEPRFMRRIGPRAFMDYTRLTQNGRWRGWIEVDGVRESVAGCVGTRDRSWGVRPVGARDPQEAAPPAPFQFFWLWSPSNFEDGSFFFHTNEDGEGHAWNKRAVFAPDQGEADETGSCGAHVAWRPKSRHATGATVMVGEETVTFEPEHTFFMLGLGYGHPKWSHGLNHGTLAVEREDFTLSEMDVTLPHHLHIQALSTVRRSGPRGERVGRGVLEQLVLGPHGPSGFAGMLDMAGVS